MAGAASSSPSPSSPPLLSNSAVEVDPWDDVIEGPENALALAGARALARGERDGISPLVVHGPSGVGKSRVLSGLLGDRLRRRPSDAVARLDAETFAAACAAAASGGQDHGAGWSELRARYRAVDLLILEDLDGLLRAPLVLEELIHTLDALDARGACVAVSTRTGPGEWAELGWPARLVNRLRGGLAVRIEPPGADARRRYLLHQAHARGVALSADTVEQLAQSADGYRTIDGWLTRLALGAQLNKPAEPTGKRGAGRLGKHHPGRGKERDGQGSTLGTASAALAPSSFSPSPFSQSPAAPPNASRSKLDPVQAAALLGEETTLAGTPMTVEGVARAVASRFNARLRDLRGPSRRASIAELRHLAMHLARLHTSASFATIGVYFGGRDPATVRHACKAAAARLQADPPLAAEVASWFNNRQQNGDRA